MSVKLVSSPPASNSNTLKTGTSDNLFAKTEPDDPPPTIIKSKNPPNLQPKICKRKLINFYKFKLIKF